MEQKELIKITAIVNRAYTNKLVDELFKYNICTVFIEAGRTSMLQEKKKFFSLSNKKAVISDPGDIISFFVLPENEKKILALIDHILDLSMPGKGSVFSSDAWMVNAFSDIFSNVNFSYNIDDSFTAYSELSGISCIVQRGSGDDISHLILDSGVSVPVSTYGTGTGVRDKLGLLRITIPAEKEIITLIMSKYDADAVMELMIAEGKLSQPGKGFIYDFPVRHGFVNTKISIGTSGQVATLEQIISAIDTLKGGIEWRKSKVDQESSSKLRFLENLTELNLICNEGYGFDLMKVAMDNGASGATISKLKFKGRGEEASKISPSHEICRMIVGTQTVVTIAHALAEASAFDEKVQGLLFSQDVNKAFTYLGPS